MKTRNFVETNSPEAKQQLKYLFAGSLVIFFVGMGLFPILPVYAARFGATSSVVGIYFALIYLANMGGSLAAGFLTGRMKRRSLFVAAGALGVPALLLMGRAASLWQLVGLTALLWFSGGLAMAMINIFTAYYAAGNQRGSTFSLMSLTLPLGALAGGTVTGRLVDWQGYEWMFAALGVLWVALPALGYLKLREPSGARPETSSSRRESGQPLSGQAFGWLMLLLLLSTTAINASRFGTSLSMQALNFTPGAIASSATLSGLIAMPATLLIGRLSDRLGHRRLLLWVYLLAAGGAFVQVLATELWHFWMAATMLLVSLTANGALTPALATEILAREAFDSGLSRLRTAAAAASILSFAGAGAAIDLLGASSLYLIAAALGLIAALQLSQVRAGQSQPEALPACQPEAAPGAARVGLQLC